MEQKRDWKKILLRILSYVLVAVVTAVLTYFVSTYVHWKDQSKLDKLEQIIDTYFIEDYDKGEIEDAAAAAMVDALGNPWSYYIPASEYQAYQDNQSNSYVGVGITIQAREDGLGYDILQVEPSGGAAAAGVEPGDILYMVEGKFSTAEGLDGTTELIRGEAGSKVTVTVLRSVDGSVPKNHYLLCNLKSNMTEAAGKTLAETIGQKTGVYSATYVPGEGIQVLLNDFSQAQAMAAELEKMEDITSVTVPELTGLEEKTFSIVRSRIQTVVATGQLLEGNVGLITIKNFNERCADETIALIKDLKNQGATSLIFDVRYNPGGYKDEMVKVLDYLLPEGQLFRSVDYSGKEEIDRSDSKCLEMPMVVLINEDSYSAAEFFAAALQEYEWATVVGTPSTGKSHFQITIDLGDGSAVNLSVGKYYTPKGVSLADVGGLQPDQIVEVDEDQYMQIYYGRVPAEEDPQITAALEVLKKGE